MKEYKVDTIGTVFKNKKGFNEAFEKLLKERAAEGWKLHSFQFALDYFCTVVFEKDTEET